VYLAHFGLHEYPFGLTPDTHYFFPGASAQAALNTLLLALDAGEGLVKIVGEVGSGKTMLCRHLLNHLDASGWATAFIPNPNLAPTALIYTLLGELGGTARRSETPSPTRVLEARLLELAHQGQRAVALIDEAQAIPLHSLEILRLVTNLETEKRKLLQIVLFGQPELDVHLAAPAVRQIRSRIVFQERITAFCAQETLLYLHHRPRQAGAETPLFSAASAARLHRHSGGMARLLNILAHKSLLLAFGEGCPQVNPQHVRLAARDTPEARRTWLDRWSLFA